jgi:hypothetical protein
MKFNTISMIKHPVDKVFTAMRDSLPLVTSKWADIHNIKEQERKAGPDGITVVNIWTAATKLPPAVLSFIGTEKFTWTDTALWNDANKICTWSIEPHQFRDSVQCKGTTVFTTAIGGQGTKITFSGDLDWKSDKFLGMAGGIGQAVLSGAEGIIRNVIQKNFRSIAEAVEAHLNTGK